MKAVILAGGLGTRIGEESVYRPKPMIEIGDKPILWHILNRYAMYNVNEFVICCGYKGHMIKEYFTNYYVKNCDIEINVKAKKVKYLSRRVEPWKVTLANTGLKTLTAGRIKKIQKYVGDDEFLLTYGDGVADIDIDKLLQNHKKSNKALTITVTKPAGRFGTVKMNTETGQILGFKEKARNDQSYVNMGYMVCSKKIFDYLGDATDMLEDSTFNKLVEDNEMNAYIHNGFWSPMDNMKDKEYLEKLYYNGEASWLD